MDFVTWCKENYKLSPMQEQFAEFISNGGRVCINNSHNIGKTHFFKEILEKFREFKNDK